MESKPLEVWTARISTKDPDRYDVSRKTGDGTFAPSWILLKAYLDIKRSGRDQTEEEWVNYCRRYLREMARSSKINDWSPLLTKSRVVLTCYCTDPSRCHRRVLAIILKEKFGAVYHGEL